MDDKKRACPICGKEFKPKTKGQVYCGRSCAAHGRARQRQAQREQKQPDPLSIRRECDYCGKLFMPRNGNQRYCGKSCASNAANAIRRVRYREKVAVQPKKRCPICGQEYQPTHNRQIFCSRKCAQRQFEPAYKEKILEPMQRMADIRITAEIPVYPNLRPKAGAVYHAEVNEGGHDGQRFYVVEVNGKRIVVRKHECMEV